MGYLQTGEEEEIGIDVTEQSVFDKFLKQDHEIKEKIESVE